MRLLLVRLSVLVSLATVIPSAACSSDGDDPGATGGTGTGASAGHGGSGALGGGGSAPIGPYLVLPPVIDVPYVLAGAGGSDASFELRNAGTLAATGLTFALTGSATLSLAGGEPQRLEPGTNAALAIHFEGAASETIAEATLTVTSAEGQVLTTPVFAVAGDPALGNAAWDTVTLPGGEACGEGITLALPTAPYPYGGAPFTDDSVRIFVSERHRLRASEDLVVHFHGHSTTLAGTLAGHLYEEHTCASGTNAVLVVPQGPVNTASGDFGKLMDPGGLEALMRQVLVVLYREGRTTHPHLGDVTLTSHSGGYWAVANNLDSSINATPVRQVDLFDSLYGFVSTYVDFAEAGGIWRSNYTSGGGTVTDNQNAQSSLEGDGFAVATALSERVLRDDPILIYFADTSHGGSTRLDGVYGEELRFGSRHHRRGARIELREAIATGASATVRWLAPFDEDTTGFRVETRTAGGTWQLAADASPGDASATFAWSGSGEVRVIPIVPGLTEDEVFSSDVYRLDAGATVLVVDGFDRVLDGSFGGLSHDFAARVGLAAGGAVTVSNEAVTEDAFDLSAWPVVVWLVGDESTDDEPLTSAERAALASYLAGGGRLVLSGSEIGYVLGPTPSGAAFLAATFGASYAADDAQSYSVSGTGLLAGVGPAGYAGAGAPYPEDYPDAFAPTGAGEPALVYANGEDAAVGIAGSAVIVGFPLELVDGDAARAEIVSSLLGFVGQ